MSTPTEERERELYYRECVAIVVVELLHAFGDDDKVLDGWLKLPTAQDRHGVRREIERFRTAMEGIEMECSLKRQELSM